jgi:hypothetical protein
MGLKIDRVQELLAQSLGPRCCSLQICDSFCFLFDIETGSLSFFCQESSVVGEAFLGASDRKFMPNSAHHFPLVG